MIKECFVLDWKIFGIINDYGSVGMVLDELRCNFSGGLCEENKANICFWARSIPKIGVTLVINWY